MYKYYAVLHMTSNDRVVYKWIKSKIIRKNLTLTFHYIVICYWYWEDTHSIMVGTISDKQISRTFQGFAQDKLQSSRTNIYSMNRHSLTAPFWTSYWLNHIMESCIIFTSSAMVDRITKYTTFHYNTYGKWLGLTYNCIWGTETAFKVRNRSEILLMHKNGFRQGSEFKGVLMT